MKTKEKQIWHTWDGDTTKDMSFVENVTGVLFADGAYIEKTSRYNNANAIFLWEHFLDSETNITAYTLGKTKACNKCVNGYALVGIDAVEPCEYCG